MLFFELHDSALHSDFLLLCLFLQFFFGRQQFLLVRLHPLFLCFDSLSKLLLVFLFRYFHARFVVKAYCVFEFNPFFFNRALLEIICSVLLPSGERLAHFVAVLPAEKALHYHAVSLGFNSELAPRGEKVQQPRVHNPLGEAGENDAMAFLLFLLLREHLVIVAFLLKLESRADSYLGSDLVSQLARSMKRLHLLHPGFHYHLLSLRLDLHFPLGHKQARLVVRSRREKRNFVFLTHTFFVQFSIHLSLPAFNAVNRELVPSRKSLHHLH